MGIFSTWRRGRVPEIHIRAAVGVDGVGERLPSGEKSPAVASHLVSVTHVIFLLGDVEQRDVLVAAPGIGCDQAASSRPWKTRMAVLRDFPWCGVKFVAFPLATSMA